jgi:hypothetical protein
MWRHCAAVALWRLDSLALLRSNPEMSHKALLRMGSEQHAFVKIITFHFWI